MPQKIICSKCGEIMYNGSDVKSPKEIMEEFNNKCPKCGKNLYFDHKNIEIKTS